MKTPPIPALSPRSGEREKKTRGQRAGAEILPRDARQDDNGGGMTEDQAFDWLAENHLSLDFYDGTWSVCDMETGRIYSGNCDTDLHAVEQAKASVEAR